MSISLQFSINRDDFFLDVNLQIPVRGITAIFGASGSGKTTLLRAIAGLELCQQGYIQVGDVIWQDGDKHVPAHKRLLGYVFQEPSLFDHLTVQGNLEYGFQRVAPANRRISLEQATSMLGIGALLQRWPHQLSGGEQQRVAIARALAASPRMLLMDEPLAALDEASKQEIFPYLESLPAALDIPVIYVSHSRDEVAQLADHLILLEHGKVQATGTVSDLFLRQDLDLAHGSDAETVIETQVGSYDQEYGLTRLDFGQGQFLVAADASLPIGSAVRLQIKATDVSLTLHHHEQSSILNIFPAQVTSIVAEGLAQVSVKVTIGSVALLARVTKKSAVDLALAPGQAVYAQVKTVALLRD